MARYKLVEGGVWDTEKFRAIPEDGGRFWEEFLAWEAQGNTPDPKDPVPEPTVDELRMKRYKEEWEKLGLTMDKVVVELVQSTVTGDTAMIDQLKSAKDLVDTEITKGGL